MRIVVVGTIVADTIEHAAGGVTTSLGGIAHSVAVLAALGGEEHTIVPLCRAGEDARARVGAWAAGLPGVSLEAVHWMAQDNPRVRLSYREDGRPGERIERLSGALPPLQAEDVAAAVAAHPPHLVLVNCITGTDCTPAALAALRACCPRLYLDVHSLALGTAADGRRFYRTRDDWSDWLGHADVVQCNLAEAATICGLPVGEGSESAVIEALAERLQAAGRDGPGPAAGPGAWLLTLAAAGAVLLQRRATGVAREHIPAPSIEAIDPTGAGDASGAGYAHAWLTGADPLACASAAVHAGTAASLLPGAPVPTTFQRILSTLN